LPVADRPPLASRPEFVAHGALIRDYFHYCTALTRLARSNAISDFNILNNILTGGLAWWSPRLLSLLLTLRIFVVRARVGADKIKID
jgi:hypothetical protein